MYLQKDKIGGFSSANSANYWSSSERDDANAWLKNFNGGGQGNFYKGNELRVRAVRDITDPTKLAKIIIGNPITIGNLLVAQNDFPIGMNWDNAKKACADLGDGWHLPTRVEITILYKNMEKIGGFTRESYWSTAEEDTKYAWEHSFGSGEQYSSDKGKQYRVRAVRVF
jgi:hypothetical protein